MWSYGGSDPTEWISRLYPACVGLTRKSRGTDVGYIKIGHHIIGTYICNEYYYYRRTVYYYTGACRPLRTDSGRSIYRHVYIIYRAILRACRSPVFPLKTLFYSDFDFWNFKSIFTYNIYLNTGIIIFDFLRFFVPHRYSL